MGKTADYAQLVTARKACHLCSGLTNPADVEGGRFDSEHIGAWSLWQGNLDASIMVVGQDWGDTTYFGRHKGREGPRNPTNLALVELVGIAGISIGDFGSAVGQDVAFFTNAILCLNLETAVDSQRRRQVRDQSGFSTAAHFTQWVTNATAANTCG
jgi:hypothetical protein